LGQGLINGSPASIIVETKHLSIYHVLENDIVGYLTSAGYRMIAKTPLDAFFVFPAKDYLDWIPKTII